MARHCQITGKTKLKGLQRSHALNSKIKFQHPNIQKKRIWVPGENRWVVVKASANALRTINKKGIKAVLKEMQAA